MEVSVGRPGTPQARLEILGPLSTASAHLIAVHFPPVQSMHLPTTGAFGEDVRTARALGVGIRFSHIERGKLTGKTKAFSLTLFAEGQTTGSPHHISAHDVLFAPGTLHGSLYHVSCKGKCIPSKPRRPALWPKKTNCVRWTRARQRSLPTWWWPPLWRSCWCSDFALLVRCLFTKGTRESRSPVNGVRAAAKSTGTGANTVWGQEIESRDSRTEPPCES